MTNQTAHAYNIRAAVDNMLEALASGDTDEIRRRLELAGGYAMHAEETASRRSELVFAEGIIRAVADAHESLALAWAPANLG